jgi:hypothetical protein
MTDDIRKEREAIAAWLTAKGQKWAADRIIAGEHAREAFVIARTVEAAQRGSWYVDLRPEPVRYRENDEPAYRNDEPSA